MGNKYAVILNSDCQCKDLLPLIKKIDFDKIIYVDDINEITYSQENYYTLIISVKFISSSLKKSIMQMMEENINISILTQRDYSSLRKYIIRLSDLDNCIYEDKSLILNRLEHDASVDMRNNEVVYLSFNNATLKSISEIFSAKNILAFSTLSHGRDDIAWLTDGAICGKALLPSLEYDCKQYPACHYKNRCFKDSLKLINASQINAKNIFINSCYSLKFNNATYGNNYNICYSFLDGIALSYMGSPYQVHGTIIMNLFYDALIKCGYSISEIVNALNNAYIQNKFGEFAPYFAIGVAHYRNKKVGEILRIKGKNSINNHINSFEICNNSVALVVLEMENSLYNFDDFLSGNLRIDIFSDKKIDIYGIPMRNKILVFTIGNFPISKLYYKMEFKNYLPLNSISNLFHIANYLDLNKKNIQKVKSLYDYTSKTYNSSIFQSHLFSQISKNIYKKLNYIEKEYITLSNEFLLNLIDRTKTKGFTLDEEFMEFGFLETNRVKSTKFCINCGSKLENVVYEHELYSLLSRNYELCDNCGIVFDSPSKLDKNVVIKLDGDKLMKAHHEYIYNLLIENNTMNDLFYSVGAAAVFSIDNNIEVQLKEPNGYISVNKSTSISINIIIPELIPPHEYWFRIYILLNGQLLSIKRSLFITN